MVLSVTDLGFTKNSLHEIFDKHNITKDIGADSIYVYAYQ